MTYIGILGSGNISETHVRAAREIAGVQIAAIFGHAREKTERLAQLYGGAAYDNLPAFLKHQPMDRDEQTSKWKTRSLPHSNSLMGPSVPSKPAPRFTQATPGASS